MKKIVIAILTCAAIPAAAMPTDCYFPIGVGRSSIGISLTEKLEDRIFASGYLQGGYDQFHHSTTREFGLGCVLSRRWGVRAELLYIDGFKHEVRSAGEVVVYQFREKFTARRVSRSRGTALSLVLEQQLSERTFVFERIGLAYAHATLDVFVNGYPISIHAEREGIVPIIGLGGRVKLDDRWSLAGEYRILGIPKVRQGSLGLHYSFR